MTLGVVITCCTGFLCPLELGTEKAIDRLLQRTHRHLEEQERSSVGWRQIGRQVSICKPGAEIRIERTERRPDQRRDQPVREPLHPLLRPCLTETVDHALEWSRTGLDLTLDDVDGVDTEPEGVSGHDTGSHGPKGRDLVSGDVLCFANVLYRGLVCSKVGTVRCALSD